MRKIKLFLQPMRYISRGFTLIEVIITTIISGVIIGGVAYLVIQANLNTQTAQYRTITYTTLTEYVDRLNSLRNYYSTGGIIVDANPGYDTVLLTNSGGTAGVLVGIANNTSTSSGYLRLAHPNDFDIYTDSVPVIQELTTSQIASIQSNAENAYSVELRKDNLFSGMHMKRFSITPYNSGSIFDVQADFYDRTLGNMVGKRKIFMTDDDNQGISVNLVF